MMHSFNEKYTNLILFIQLGKLFLTQMRFVEVLRTVRPKWNQFIQMETFFPRLLQIKYTQSRINKNYGCGNTQIKKISQVCNII